MAQTGPTQYLEDTLLNLIFGATAYTAPVTLYVGLSTGLATATVVEPSGNAYARVAVTNNVTNWPNATGSYPASKSNANAITFAASTGSWGTVQSFFIADALSSGNILWQGALNANQTIGTGTTFSFAGGALVFTLD